MKKILILILAVGTLLQGGCAIHTPEIQQGNIIDDKAVATLRPGMTRSQVRFVLGNPALKDPFHANRWDYIYTLDTGIKGQPPQRRHLAVFFTADTLERFVSDPPLQP
ncbi:MAG: outer membrane protein assembly factor BamE [Gammaproteobacteria bacterium]|nr:outer membrane protein assembly factor BamE [Gammaproteobacteria bacterium]